MEQKYIQVAIDYKKNIAGKFVLVEGAKLKQRVEGERICVTKKIDGHLQVVFWQDGSVFMLNASGKQRAENLKCLDAFAETMKAAGVKSATIAAELYLSCPDGRPRCGNVLVPSSSDDDFLPEEWSGQMGLLFQNELTSWLSLGYEADLTWYGGTKPIFFWDACCGFL